MLTSGCNHASASFHTSIGPLYQTGTLPRRVIGVKAARSSICCVRLLEEIKEKEVMKRIALSIVLAFAFLLVGGALLGNVTSGTAHAATTKTTTIAMSQAG